MAHVWIGCALLFFVAVAASNGKLKADRLNNVAFTLGVIGLFYLIIGASRLLSQDTGNAIVWFSWGGAALVCAFIAFVASAWVYARFELPTKRYVTK